jgi:UDP-glucose 4-epimerase
VSGRRILITGAGSYVGSSLAARLEREPWVEAIFAVDTRPPRLTLERTEVIDADIRSPVLGRLLPQIAVDTVVHNQIVRQPGPNMSPRKMHEINVIGTLQLLTACEKADSVRAIVIRGSAGIYGAEAGAPQFFTEEASRLYPPRTRFQRDVAEIENYFEAFARRHSRVVCTMLRYQPAIGPTVQTQITRYLSLPVVPTYLGFDPRLQFIHEEDAVAALVAAVQKPVRGAVNVAAPGTIGLTRMLRLLGKPTLPLVAPLFELFADQLARLRIANFSEDFRRLLRYGRGVDISRLCSELGYEPRYTTEEAVREFAATREGMSLVPSLRRLLAAVS